MTHAWHDVTPGEHLPSEFTAVIEIPMGSSVKYELDKETGLLAAGPHPLLGGLLPGQLRLHPADLGRGRRSARRAGAVPGAGGAADAGEGAGHRPDDHDRQRQEGPQDPGRGRRRSGVQRLPRGRRVAGPSPDHAAASSRTTRRWRARPSKWTKCSRRRRACPSSRKPWPATAPSGAAASPRGGPEKA